MGGQLAGGDDAPQSAHADASVSGSFGNGEVRAHDRPGFPPLHARVSPIFVTYFWILFLATT
jgi:hypothetical protein